MTAPTIRAALERLTIMAANELDMDTPGLWAHSRASWDDAMTAARAALAAAPEGEPSKEELVQLAIDTRLYRFQATAGDPIQYEMSEQQVHAFARAVLSRWGRPAAPAAPSEGEGPAAWLYLGEPDFNGTAWRENWCVTTDEALARSKAGPGCPVPLFRRPTAPSAPSAPLEGEVGELVAALEADAECAEVEHYDLCNMTADQMRRAATLLEQLSAAAPAVVPDGPAVPKSTEPASVAAETTGQPQSLSPAAQAVLDTAVLPCTIREGIAAALRAVADQVVPDEITWASPSEQARHWPSAAERAGRQDMACVVRRKLLALAAELEGCNA